MAKLKAPLLSLGASQKLGNALVFFNWKGIDAVREYVIPANPRTTPQTTQRDYLKAAVAKIHTAQARATHPLDTDDQTAYALLSRAIGMIMTWFNTALKLWLDVKVAGDKPIIYSDGSTNVTTRTGVIAIVYLNEETASSLANGKWYMGKSLTNLVHAYTANITPGVQAEIPATNISSWAAVGDKIYWQFRPDAGDPCEGADSGIYSFVAT